MDLKKEKTVKEIYAKLLKVGFGNGAIQEMPQFIAEDVMGYGTALDEKILSIEEFKELIHDQRKQSKDFDEFRYTSSPVIIRLAENGQSAVIVDEIELVTVIDGKSNQLPLRMSTVMELIGGTWKIIHWHGSLAEHVSDGEDPWHVTQWIQKTEKLQRMVDEKTADLETKNRELEIEASLERVRAVTMGMQKPDDLLDVCQIISEQLETLKVKNIRNVQVAIIDESKKSYLNYQFFTPYSKKVFEVTEYENHPASQAMVDEMQKSANSFFTGRMEGEVLDGFRKWRKKYDQFPDTLLDRSDAVCYYFYSIGQGGLGLTTYEEISNESLEIFKRFHKVFMLAYQRFNDIRQAMEQAREAQIEAVLEKIRAQVTAMQESSELLDIVVMMQAEFIKLGHEAHYFWHMRWLPDKYEKALTNGEGTRIGNVLELPRGFHGLKTMLDWEKTNEPSAVFALDPDTAADYIDKMIKLGRFQEIDHSAPGPEEVREMGGLTFVMARTTHGEIGYTLPGEVPNPPVEDIATLVRFAGVFDLAYRRFEDLKLAEQRNRQTQVELALERTRTQSMLMRHSDELLDISKVFHEQLLFLSIEAEFSFVWLPDEAKGEHMFWATWMQEQEEEKQFHTKALSYPLDMEEPYTVACYRDWRSGVAVHEHFIKPEEVAGFFKSWEELLAGAEKLKPAYFPDGIYYTEAYMRYGCFGIDIRRSLSQEEKNILLRFAIEFERVYTRFLDLQKSEAQAREAQIETGLEKVRSRTLAMQRSDELSETAAVLFQQLIQLGIEPNRLYIGITQDDSTQLEFWITDEDGSKVDTMFNADAAKNNSMKKMYEGWKQRQKSIVIDMQGKVLEDYFHYLGDELHIPFKGGLSQKRRWQYIAYFSRGLIGMASPDEQPAETLQLLERFAYVFNLTLTRFNDLKIAEANALKAQQDLIEIKVARKNAEKALADLKATQSQLVHAEKMASLGELTAGIAHEIQNPLNFVNNFSEVSAELIDEMKQELAVGGWQLAAEIADDIRQNLQKINHHGRRADAIVKSMLQHSRTSNGQKTLTDINALADEYLRLSYHGLRAKDKSFNADFKLVADENLPGVNIVPQDIGRVLLNLINNAFYAVSEKSKLNLDGYRPGVIVSTKRLNGNIEIRVNDNGNGIPDPVKDKIFLPFFTTKPTGEGTGLGLSMSYDIITKGHGGKIDVESEPGKGTGFIIIIPINQENNKQ